MAEIASNVMTYADWTSRRDPKGMHAQIGEVMSRKDEAFADIMFMEANEPLSHRDTLRSELPVGEFRRFNQGVGRGTSKTENIVDSIANLQLYGVVDKDLADLSGDAATFRFGEEKGVMQGMTQQWMDTLWYGDINPNPEQFTGFTPRYNDLSADHVVDAGGRSATEGAQLTSIWFIVWGNDGARGIFPKGHSDSAGLSSTDKGVETVTDPKDATKEFEAYRTHYKMMGGLSIKDYRQVVRVANIDVNAGSADLVDLLIEAESWLENADGAKLYMNRAVKTMYNKQAKDSAHLSIDEIDGKQQLNFWGHPMRRSDSLINNESEVS